MLLPIGDNLERPHFPVATVALIFVNIAVFAITSKMELTGRHLVDTGTKSQAKKVLEVKEFYNTWGSVPAKLKEGEVIGLLTHMFLHAGLAHLIGNMLVLWVFGQSLETALGSFAFVTLYVFWGAVACVTQCAMDFSSEVFLIGASGAIAGVMGGYILLFGYSAQIKMLLLIGFFPFRFAMPASVFGFLWIMQQMYNASLDVEGALTGVAWMAHVGGFMAGLATMWVFRHQTDQVVISEGKRRYFGKREDLQKAAEARDPDAALNIDLDDESCVVEIHPRPCPACGTEINKSHKMGDRLLRCPNSKCAQLTYLTDEELQPEYVV